jgi:hypothetical protein
VMQELNLGGSGGGGGGGCARPVLRYIT